MNRAPLEQAKRYTERGWRVVPMPSGRKGPVIEEWQLLRLTEEELPQHFSNGENIGVLTGEPSGGLVDVDLDSPEARALAKEFLPKTDLRHGRPSSPDSHSWYRADPIPSTEKFRDPTVGSGDDYKAMLVELRANGCQTVLPDSVHPDGEDYRWESEDEPAVVDGRVLRHQVALVASCALLARHWPEQGSRQDMALALAGVLLRSGWEVIDVEHFIESVAGVAGDEETMKRITAGEFTARRINADLPATGIPRLKEYVDPRVVDRVIEWLELRSAAKAVRPDTPVDLAPLLEYVRAFVRRHVVLNESQADAITLWVAHTWALEAADSTPYLSITSAEKRSGKTRLLEVLELLVARPWLTGRVTPAVLYRKIDAECSTLLLDESDAAFKGDKDYAQALRGVLNTGHRRGGNTSTCVGQGTNISYRDFSTFSPKAIAGIGRLPDTVADRSIAIVLKRRAPNESVQRFRRREAVAFTAPMQEMLAHWSVDAVNSLKDARPAIPTLDDRAADGWEPLLAIADAAGGEWTNRARKAALALSVGDGRDDDSNGVRLLSDIRAIIEERGTDRLSSGALAEALVGMEEAPWGDLRGKSLDARGLARRLRPFGIRPRQVRFEEKTLKGYTSEDFADAWARYTPRITETTETSETKGDPRFNLDGQYVSDVSHVSLPAGMVQPSSAPSSVAPLRPTDGPLVRFAVQQLGLPIAGRRPPCGDCGSPGEHTDPETGEWWCGNHGPTWTAPRHARP